MHFPRLAVPACPVSEPGVLVQTAKGLVESRAGALTVGSGGEPVRNFVLVSHTDSRKGDRACERNGVLS